MQGTGGAFAGVFNVKMDLATIPGPRLGREGYVVAEATLPGDMFEPTKLLAQGK